MRRIQAVLSVVSFASVILAFAPSTLRAQAPAPEEKPDVLLLNSGETLLGALESSDPDTVTFNSRGLGQVTVAWTKIKELHAAKAFAVIPKSERFQKQSQAQSVAQGSIAVENQQIAVNPTAPSPSRVAVDSVYLVKKDAFDAAFHSPGLFRNWSGNLAIGSSIMLATQRSTNFTGQIQLDRIVPGLDWRAPSNRTDISFLSSYSWSRNLLEGQDADKVKTFVYQASAEHDRYLNSRVFGFLAVSFNHSLSQNLELQQSYFAGAGLVVLKRSRDEFDLRGTVGYVQRGYYLSDFNATLIGSRFSESYDYQFKGIHFNEELYGIPAWNHSDKWETGGKAALYLPLSEKLSLELSSIDSYLHGAPPTYKRNSFQLTMGLAYSLR